MDMSEMDIVLIRYLKALSVLLSIEKIIFLHNVRLRELPAEMRKPELLPKIQARVKVKIEKLLNASLLSSHQNDILVETEEFSENAFGQLTKKHKVDLVMLGNKQHLEGTGGLAQKLARLLPSNLLLIPETVQLSPKTYLGAIDFSKYSKWVYQVTKFFTERNSQHSLHLIHVAKVPVHFFLGLSEVEIKRMLKEETEIKKTKWMKQHHISSAIEIIQADGRHIASSILQYAALNKVDMLIMGMKGVSTITNLFIGGVTNEIFHHDTDVAILILKDNQKMSL